ncbi:MAG TPA: AMP-binding protein [Longimicrobiaceae bacterium]|nr:AMP-binding protein [Longimicrobiaceae bacterium]
MTDTAAAVFLARAAQAPGRPALRLLAAGGAPRDETLAWGEWAEASRRFAAALVAGGHRPGETVAILAGSGFLWPVADLGVLLAGGVSVGLYPTSAPAQVRQVLADCGAATLVVDTAQRLALVQAVRAELPRLRTVVAGQVDGWGEAVGWDGWLARGADALAAGAGDEVDRRVRAARPEDTAILIYTSGSTGEPKGAEIPHRYLLASAASIVEVLGLTAGDTTLSFLPFSHAAERVFGLHTRIACGMEAALVPDHTRLWEAARGYGPTLFGGLPRLYEKAFETLRDEHQRAGGAERERWDRVAWLGTARSRLRQAGGRVPPGLEAEWAELGAPLFARVRALFGGRVRVATSGGAALPGELAEYLDALGLTVLGAYGLTEHLCVAFNRPARYRFDAAGPPMPGTELRVAEDGEILVRRGPLTFAGYRGRPEETRAAFSADGEWLLTGDLGAVGEDGALRVIGRKKELIALSTGKKVAPLPIEALLAQDPWIGQAMLYGEGQKFVSALLALRPAMLKSWAAERALRPDYPAVLEHPEVRARVRAAVDRVNQGLSRTEQIRRFVVIARELTAEDGELTPTLKLRRATVAEKFRAELDALYQTAP